MNEDVLLTLHCPQCKQMAEVVVENHNLVCLECGWKFDDKTAARFLGASGQEKLATPLEVSNS